MSEPVNARRYVSPLRKQQAASTRTRIAAAAGQLFAARGFVPTSIEQIAEAAGVARPTVYTSFNGKAAILKAALDLRFSGDDAPMPVSQRPWFRRVLESKDQHQMLEEYAGVCRSISERVGDLYEAVRNAVGADPEIARLHQDLKDQRHDGARVVIDALTQLRALRDGMERDTATDLLWYLNDPAAWTALVTDRGWKPHDYQRWLARTMQETLLA